MSQNNSIIIHNLDGQRQMIKVVPTNNNYSQSYINVKKNPVKVIKIKSVEDHSQRPPVLQPIKLKEIKFESKYLPSQVVKKIVPKKELTRGLQDTVENTKPSEVVPKFIPLYFKSEPKDIEIKYVRQNHTPDKVMSHASRRRHDSDNDPPAEYTTKRRKHADKVGKGLRHFSMKVCEKVRNKGFTSYNEVADELVLEFAAGMHGSADSQQYDQKNIRRRVYDALNVLMAMNIISKEKKEIRWLGLPTNSVQECTSLEKEKAAKIEIIQKKTQQLQELILQHISFKSLIERNKEAENKGVKPSPSSAIHLPFIVVNTSDKALIDCSISNDKTEYMFNFNKRFHIHDDIDILKRMGLLYGLDKGECSKEDLRKVKSMVPKSLETYVEQMGTGEHDTYENFIVNIKEEHDDGGDDDETFDGEVDGEEDAEADGNDYSDDSSDVDV